MKHFIKHGLMAAYLIAQAMPAAADGVALDHQGNDREIIVESHDSDSRITSRGDGGVLDAVISHSSDIDLYHLGGNSEGVVDIHNSDGTNVVWGHCTKDTSHERAQVNNKKGGLIIVPCQ